ncbi:MAG: hypothetical protein JO166_01555 [Deltaproteobacteria bacterium]|nr:hypothetical protein [Deltaproteobacteria bacterium]
MAAFKVEKMLNWGVAYSPEMQTGGKPAPDGTQFAGRSEKLSNLAMTPS